MKRLSYSILAIAFSQFATAQLTQPESISLDAAPNFAQSTKAPGDSCGVYWNNYVGLNKTNTLFFEALRTGSGTDFAPYNGRAQRFNCPQPMEISGIQFYAFETNPLVDSLMAITLLYDYVAANDSVGALLATDTVYVTHQAFDVVLPNVEVNSFFDTPVTVTNDYMVAVMTPEDDSLKIMVSDFAGGDGNGEGVSYLYYGNPVLPSFEGWYNALGTFGAGYDGDYLINPRVKYDLHDDFLLSDDSICPNVVSAACVTYAQQAVYGDPHYNSYYSTQDQHLLWLWGDGFQNTNLLNACHTYSTSGDYNIQLNDTLRRHDFFSPFCVGQHTEPIHVISDPVANFTFVQTASTVDFTNTSTTYDSLWWDFGDTTAGTNQMNPTHVYDSLGTYDVWLVVYNECGVDSIMMQVTTDDVGLDDYDFDFNVYPNPANDNVVIAGLSEGLRVEILNILGATVMQDVTMGHNLTLATDQLTNGTYFVRVSSDKGQVTKKLVVRH